MKMHKEVLRKHLHNQPLEQAIVIKRDHDKTRANLLSALNTLIDIGIQLGEEVTAAINNKAAEYLKISQGYGQLLQDVFGISWQMEAVIKKYVDCTDDEIDKLPEYVGW